MPWCRSPPQMSSDIMNNPANVGIFLETSKFSQEIFKMFPLLWKCTLFYGIFEPGVQESFMLWLLATHPLTSQGVPGSPLRQ